MAAPILYTLDGREWRFPILTPMDLITLGKVIYSRVDKRALVESMTLTGMSQDDQRERLLLLDQAAGSAGAIGGGLYRLENAYDALRASVAKLPEGERPDIDAIPVGDVTGLAIQVCNFVVEKREEAVDPDEVNPTKASGQ